MEKWKLKYESSDRLDLRNAHFMLRRKQVSLWMHYRKSDGAHLASMKWRDGSGRPIWISRTGSEADVLIECLTKLNRMYAGV